jgi:hypothetical protein
VQYISREKSLESLTMRVSNNGEAIGGTVERCLHCNGVEKKEFNL